MANGNDAAYGADNAAAFAAVWTALLLIFISILGTIIMRRVSNNIVILSCLFSTSYHFNYYLLTIFL